MDRNFPIIKTFIVDDECFFYDTYQNRILSVSKELFAEIHKLQRMGIFEYTSTCQESPQYSNIIMLMRKGYLKGAFVESILHPDSYYLPDMVARCINDITLQVTKDCNFKCRYCLFTKDNDINRHHERVNMTWDVAQKSIDFLYQNSKDTDTLTISFYGGEPLLNFSLIRDIVRYVETKFATKEIIYHMTTNGSVISDEIADFLIGNNFNLLISLDGPPNIQNMHRKFYYDGSNTFEIVSRNIKRLKEKNNKYFEKYVKFIPVVLKGESYKQILEFYAKLNVDESKVNYVFANLDGIDYWPGFSQSNSDNVYSTDDMWSQKDLHTMDDIISNKNVIPARWHHNGPCIPGINRLFVDTSGNFYPCEKVLEVPLMVIGNLDEGLDIDKVENYLNIGRISENECKSCWAMRFCDICVSKCIDIENQCISKEQKNISCKATQQKCEKFLKLLIKDIKIR